MVSIMNAGRMVRLARRRAGMSQRDVARAAGVPQPNVARVERGSVIPRADTLERLLRATGHRLVAEPRLGIGVDRSMIRDRLRMSPAERIRLAVAEARAMPTIRLRR